MMKTCSQCKTDKPLEDFHNRKSSKDGKQTYCKPCAIQKVTQWQQDNPEKFEANWKKHVANPETLLKRKAKKYGISVKELSDLLTEADGKCSICKTDTIEVFVIDHCHDTLKVRGILCSKCNLALGLFDDNVESLQNAILYLTKT